MKENFYGKNIARLMCDLIYENFIAASNHWMLSTRAGNNANKD